MKNAKTVPQSLQDVKIAHQLDVIIVMERRILKIFLPKMGIVNVPHMLIQQMKVNNVKGVTF
jgi:hypothetical protein